MNIGVTLLPKPPQLDPDTKSWYLDEYGIRVSSIGMVTVLIFFAAIPRPGEGASTEVRRGDGDQAGHVEREVLEGHRGC